MLVQLEKSFLQEQNIHFMSHYRLITRCMVQIDFFVSFPNTVSSITYPLQEVSYVFISFYSRICSKRLVSRNRTFQKRLTIFIFIRPSNMTQDHAFERIRDQWTVRESWLKIVANEHCPVRASKHCGMKWARHKNRLLKVSVGNLKSIICRLQKFHKVITPIIQQIC